MWGTCYGAEMTKMVQIRNLPEETHRVLKARAALEGTTLSQYLVAELNALAERPSQAELLARLAAQAGKVSTRDVVAAVHAGRQDR